MTTRLHRVGPGFDSRPVYIFILCTRSFTIDKCAVVFLFYPKRSPLTIPIETYCVYGTVRAEKCNTIHSLRHIAGMPWYRYCTVRFRHESFITHESIQKTYILDIRNGQTRQQTNYNAKTNKKCDLKKKKRKYSIAPNNNVL